MEGLGGPNTLALNPQCHQKALLAFFPNCQPAPGVAQVVVWAACLWEALRYMLQVRGAEIWQGGAMHGGGQGAPRMPLHAHGGHGEHGGHGGVRCWPELLPASQLGGVGLAPSVAA